MEKKEKKADLEQLLNSLIERGWKPRGEGVYKTKKKIRNLIRYIERPKEIWFYVLYDGLYNQMPIQRRYILRQLVSKESGLWQFCCENGMIDNLCETRYWRNHFELDEIEYNQPDFQYWLIESALKDESELEEFLLSNIKVGNEQL